MEQKILTYADLYLRLMVVGDAPLLYHGLVGSLVTYLD